MNKTLILNLLREFVSRRPGLEYCNYGSSTSYRAELRALTRQLREARRARLLGRFAGFALVLGASLYAGNRPALALRDGAVGCLVGAALFRVLHAAFLASLRARGKSVNNHTHE